MIRRQVVLVNRLGLHARAASKLVSLAGRHASRITLGHPGQPGADARNIMTLLMLGAPCGTTLDLTCEGPDEQVLADAICALIQNRFDEDD